MINLDILTKQYFYFDKPVIYSLSSEKTIEIIPITVENSEMFLSWVDLISIDKNSLNDPTFISMSYLDFIIKAFVLSSDEQIAQLSRQKLGSLLQLCLGWRGSINFNLNERNKIVLQNKDIIINSKQFEDIRRIILYQNLIDFDDSYINPDLKAAIQEVDALRNKSYEFPNLERRMAIITAHTGIPKSVQMNMTYRSHSMLFREVYGEVDFISVRTAVLIGNMFSKKKNELEDWIYKKKQGKYERYFTDMQSYSDSMGGSISMQNAPVDIGNLKDYF